MRRLESFNERKLPKMRKDEKQKNVGAQLELFDRATGKPKMISDGVSTTKPSLGAELFSRLKEQHNSTGQLLEKVVDYTNLVKAFKRVRQNDGASGVDEMNVEELRRWLKDHVKELCSDLVNETYEPEAVRKVEIEKPDGGTRILGIPTVKDRFVQQAIHQELSILYDPYFSDSSFGFRPNRSTHQAVKQAQAYIEQGNEWVVDIDLEKFFDTINQDRLMQRLSKGIGDKRTLRLINKFLKAGAMVGGLEEQRIAGTPQGGPLSPLLSNIVLDELDKELELRGHKFCRYADDCNIYVKSEKAGQRVMESITNFIEKKLKLRVNRDKSGVRHCSKVKFLGYTILAKGGIRVADKSIQRFKEKVKKITKRNRGVKFERVIADINQLIRGWTNYFKLANSWLKTMEQLDGWIRRKLRCYKLKQCGRRYTIFKFLRSLGSPINKTWNAIMFTQGWWKLSKKIVVGHAMNLNWFAKIGLLQLTTRLVG